MYKIIAKYLCITSFLLLVVMSFSASAITRQQYVNDLISKAEQYSKQEGKSFLSINYINEAIKIQPRNLDIYFKRAAIYARLKLFTEAVKDLNLIYKNAHGHKKYKKAIKYRAECFAALGEYGRAIADYKTMIKNGSKRGKIGKIYYYYAELLWYVGNKDEALNVIARGKRTGSHWISHMNILENKILSGIRIKKLHRPFSN